MTPHSPIAGRIATAVMVYVEEAGNPLYIPDADIAAIVDRELEETWAALDLAIRRFNTIRRDGAGWHGNGNDIVARHLRAILADLTPPTQATEGEAHVS